MLLTPENLYKKEKKKRQNDYLQYSVTFEGKLKGTSYCFQSALLLP